MFVKTLDADGNDIQLNNLILGSLLNEMTLSSFCIVLIILGIHQADLASLLL